jgi:broad specificity phosphatase PhoE
MRIVEVRRHAERDAEENLTAKGLAQCAAAKRTLEFPYHAYVVSPAKRARLTMEALGGVNATVEKRLAPRPRPPFERSRRRHEELMAAGMDPVTAWYAIPEAGPLLAEVGREALASVLDIAAKLPERGRALAVSHGGTIEPVAVIALGLPYASIFGDRELANCEGVRAYVLDARVVRLDVVRLPVVVSVPILPS